MKNIGARNRPPTEKNSYFLILRFCFFTTFVKSNLQIAYERESFRQDQKGESADRGAAGGDAT
jgi:hypothetical protein